MGQKYKSGHSDNMGKIGNSKLECYPVYPSFPVAGNSLKSLDKVEFIGCIEGNALLMAQSAGTLMGPCVCRNDKTNIPDQLNGSRGSTQEQAPLNNTGYGLSHNPCGLCRNLDGLSHTHRVNNGSNALSLSAGIEHGLNVHRLSDSRDYKGLMDYEGLMNAKGLCDYKGLGDCRVSEDGLNIPWIMGNSALFTSTSPHPHATTHGASHDYLHPIQDPVNKSDLSGLSDLTPDCPVHSVQCDYHGCGMEVINIDTCKVCMSETCQEQLALLYKHGKEIAELSTSCRVHRGAHCMLHLVSQPENTPSNVLCWGQDIKQNWEPPSDGGHALEKDGKLTTAENTGPVYEDGLLSGEQTKGGLSLHSNCRDFSQCGKSSSGPTTCQPQKYSKNNSNTLKPHVHRKDKTKQDLQRKALPLGLHRDGLDTRSAQYYLDGFTRLTSTWNIPLMLPWMRLLLLTLLLTLMCPLTSGHPSPARAGPYGSARDNRDNRRTTDTHTGLDNMDDMDTHYYPESDNKAPVYNHAGSDTDTAHGTRYHDKHQAPGTPDNLQAPDNAGNLQAPDTAGNLQAPDPPEKSDRNSAGMDGEDQQDMDRSSEHYKHSKVEGVVSLPYI